MPRFRPRFSLLTLLLVTTIVVLGLVVWKQWRELVPLRAEVRQMRGQLGFLSIDDETRPYAIQVHEWDDDVWRWRIYLPPGGKYKLYEAAGLLPAHGGKPDARWLQAVQNAPNVGRGMFSSVEMQGTFTLEARLSPRDGGWQLRTVPGGGDSVYHFRDGWLSDETVRTSTVVSDVGTRQQREFKLGEPILLFYLAKPNITTTPAQPGQHYGLPKDSAEGIVLWLGL